MGWCQIQGHGMDAMLLFFFGSSKGCYERLEDTGCCFPQVPKALAWHRWVLVLWIQTDMKHLTCDLGLACRIHISSLCCPSHMAGQQKTWCGYLLEGTREVLKAAS